MNSFNEWLAAKNSPYGQACPVCEQPATSRCKCTGPHTIEQVKKGHGFQCANKHRWSGDLVVVETFVQPKGVPEPVVWAVYRIAHNQATADDWEALDEQIAKTSLEQVLKWIGDILVANPTPNITNLETEIQWFKQQLTRSGGMEN